MKKHLISALLLISVLGAVTACDHHQADSTTPNTSTTPPVSSSGGGELPSSTTSVIDSTGKPVTGPRLEIYYLRYDENYTNWGLWTWNSSATPSPSYGFMFDTKTVKFPATEDLQWSVKTVGFDLPYNYYSDWNFSTVDNLVFTRESFGEKLGIIVRDKSGNKDVGDDRFIDMAKADADNDQVYQVYLVTDDTNIYYSIDSVPTSGIKSVEFASNETADFVRVNASMALDPAVTVDKVTVKDAGGNILPIASVSGFAGGHIELVLENRLTAADLKKTYCAYFEDYPIADGSGYPIAYESYYSSAHFDALFTYDGELGSYIENGNTVFKLWAPTASAVKLNVYDNGTAATPSSTYDLTEGEKGVWAYTLTGNQHGKYYSFDVTVYGQTNRDVADPYGKSANANGRHSMVVDFANSAVLPADWGTATAPEVSSGSAPIVYETHVRDFSMGESWNGAAENRGKYLGLSETGTKLSDNSTKTGFDYVKELGVTHVQLLPIYDFKSVDETKISDPDYQNKVTDGVYNWGYDPQSYNSPEGSYSSDPNDGNTRVKELRTAVKNYNEAGIGIIMDVVYNHMPGSSGTTFEQIVPGYYFRGTNNSGAGADMASEKPMFKKFVVDSTKMWMENYNLAGFRFDLMGLLTKKTMQEVSTTLHQVNPDAIIYGEGWSMFANSPYSPEIGAADMATQGNIKGLNIGAFNDTARDALKGSVFNAADPGWATALDSAKTKAAKESVKYGIVGTQAHAQVASASSTVYDTTYTGSNVVYAEAHDNETLHDKIRLSVPGLTEAEYNDIQSLVNNIIFTSLGISFFHSGTEFGRSKLIPTDMVSQINPDKMSCNSDKTVCYSKDSYNLTDKINAIDWNLVKTNAKMVQAFKDVAELKKSNPLLRSDSYDNIGARYVFDDCGYAASSAEALGLIAYTVKAETSSTETYSEMYVVHNSSSKSVTLGGHQGWKVLIGGEDLASSSMQVPAHSSMILGHQI